MLVKKSYEPFLYKFLAIAKDIFKKTGSRNIILFGQGEQLRFIANNYAGIFYYHTEKLDRSDYEFGHYAYEISSLPNDDIKLEKIDHYPCADEYLNSVKMFFKSADLSSKLQLELYSNEECKIAKILSTTGCWLQDDEVKFLNKFKELNVYTCDNKELFTATTNNEWNDEYILINEEVEFDNGNTTAAITLIFNTRYNPRKNEVVQQKINFTLDAKEIAKGVIDNTEIVDDKTDVETEEKELDDLMSTAETELEEIDEEFEDDFDPMLA